MTANHASAHQPARQRRHGSRLAVALLLAAKAGLVGAQQSGAAPAVVLGGDVDERLRLEQLVPRTTPAASAGDVTLIRSTSRLSTAMDSAMHWRVGVVVPEVRAVRNSGIPYSLNDGPLWAARGWSESVTGGISATAPHVRLIVAPTLISSDNEIFQVIPYPQNAAQPRNVWANPFHPLPESIDLPLRFGDRRLQRVDAGQSSLTVAARGVAFGVATENLWWGPGIRNALTLSNNAAGFPHAFVQTRTPVRTPAGSFDAQWIVGQLTESSYFDADQANDRRSLAGVALTWSPAFDSTLTLGVARLVMGARRSGAFPIGAAFDVLRTVGHLDVDTATAVPANARDQILSFFGRWVFPAAGFEAYAEWARFEEPRSLRDFLEYPEHSEGYTLGFQWAHPMRVGAFRLQSEATYVEPDPSLRLRPTAVTYTSRAVPQGFTQRGQMLGASIGPGASSQWIAGEVFAPRWRVGPYLSRIRWDNGTLEEPIVPQFKRQDVTLAAGLRGGVTWRGASLLVDVTHAARFNYLFQTYYLGVAERTAGIDLVNNTVSVSVAMPAKIR